MENFEFLNPTKIIFGKGTQFKAGKEIKQYGKKVLLHYGSGSIKRSGLYDALVKSLKDEGVEFVELGGVQPNPRLSLVRRGVDICRENKAEAILAVGGGSVIDSAKAIAIGACYEGDVWDFYTGKATPEAILPVGVVLTIPAAGSESSVASVITNEDGLLKRACGHPVLMPKFAIMNPELTYTLPAYQTVCGACDIMAHVMESYFTPAKKTDYSDRLCEATLKTVINNVRIVLREPENYEARADIMWAGTIANNNLLAMGRVQDWGSHMIEHELSALYDVTHGAGLSVIFPAWMKYVYKADVNRFVQFAVRVWGVDLAFESLDDIVLEGIRRIKAFFTEIGLPVSLKELDIPDDKFEEMAAKCTAGGPVGSFKKIYREDAVKVYELAK